ncbi:ABC transporter ATP-binding protein [Microlunatus parietis]|uniref:ABC-type multidrug transport system fused ATPase/permease subunit n=1 Tax=Microlunatus parietis TaxID=682979 RepID=A0A7Y9IB80_9ACTN|nr:ABC transporter ATP-binding protein [Microlunatus parietis]NYE73721.1 ABC-type multidrug transport system fused ATPase/permease subunit [Microlunatus parietis]
MMVRTRLARLASSGRGVLTLIRLLPRLDRRLAAILGVSVLVTAALPVAAAVLTGLLIGSIPAAVAGGSGSAAMTETLRLLVVVGVLVLVDRMVAPVATTAGRALGRELDSHLAERVMAAVGRPEGIAHLEDPETLDEIRIARGLGSDLNRAGRAVEALPRALPSWLRALGSAGVLFALEWWLGVIWLIVWPLTLLLMQREYVKIGAVIYGQSSALRRSEYLRDLALEAGPAKELRILGLRDWLIGRFEESWLAAMRPVWRSRRPDPLSVGGSVLAIIVVDTLSYGLLVAAGLGVGPGPGQLSLAAVAVFVQALAGVNSFMAFDDDNAHLAAAALLVPKVLAMSDRLDAADALAAPERAPALTRRREVAPELPRDELRFEGVTFRYPNAEKAAIDGLDLVVPAGRSLAVVGRNGAGKTSLVKLLCGLYRPTAGRITVDGTDLAELDPDGWRSRLAVLFQDFARYHLTIADNIALGAPQHSGDRDRLELAAQRAGLESVIEVLPDGWETVLSREYTGGVDLSGGQWQRVALARAMFAVDAGARVLVLDEPTAALDVRAEAALYDRFLELTEGLTTWLISHRFSTVRRADRIVVLDPDRGGIAEDGDHDRLLAAGGAYARMFTLQAERFAGRS